MIDNVSIPCTYSNNVYTGTYRTGSESFTYALDAAKQLIETTQAADKDVQQKTVDFMNDFGLGDYAIPDDELDEVKFEKCAFLLKANLEQIQIQQRKVSRHMSEELKKILCEMVNND